MLIPVRCSSHDVNDHRDVITLLAAFQHLSLSHEYWIREIPNDTHHNLSHQNPCKNLRGCDFSPASSTKTGTSAHHSLGFQKRQVFEPWVLGMIPPLTSDHLDSDCFRGNLKISSIFLFKLLVGWRGHRELELLSELFPTLWSDSYPINHHFWLAIHVKSWHNTIRN